jgi:TRAP-type mannitol/chloroaromatic compound transport system substrate-binding protein
MFAAAREKGDAKAPPAPAAPTAPAVVARRAPSALAEHRPAKDIFHSARWTTKKVNDMTGGDLRIEVLPAGAIVPAFGLLDAVSRERSTAAMVLVYHYGKQNALALWGSARPSAWTAT